MKNSKIFGYIIVSLLITFQSSISFSQDSNPLKGKKILVFSSTKGFRHGSIPSGQAFFFKLGQEKGFQVDTTENAALFTEENLAQYPLVVFLNTTGTVFNAEQKNAFQRYIQAGGGYLGIHSATDTEHNWAWYAKLAGGHFASHPGNPNVQTGTFIVQDVNHISTKNLPKSFNRTDEFYDIKHFNEDVNVLITVEEKTYKDGKMGDFHPMSWYHEFDGGRAFYTNWGHTNESFSEPIVIDHIWGGLQWVADKPAVDFKKKLRTAKIPENNRFRKVLLDTYLDEPTELAIAPNGKIFYASRKGHVKMYNEKTGEKKEVAKLDVYNGQEYGLMGLNLDPKFEENHWMYLYYSPPSGQEDTAQHLSRFVYDDVNDKLLMETEKILLRVPVKRVECCHTGGSIEWDAAGNLYLSTGDDTNPFASDGYGPMDNRKDRQGWDARYTSSNTNDLRGKILRIKPQDDGTYTIPEGNLFPPNTYHARAEIYVMGNRNPYRISVDKHNGYLYWGEVGPDAGENSDKYGPRGHDEVNQARGPGYFGWPLFVGDNKAYRKRDFNTNETFEYYNPEAPINDSPHNTGMAHLPKAQKAFIYYPYADSPEFGPMLKTGGRNAMAGQVYHVEDYQGDKKFPAYFDGKLFAYDWARDIVYTVTMDENDNFDKMERFLPEVRFSHPMDMVFSKNGELYGLEYGPNWFAPNPEASLYKIEYNSGNRPPVAVANANKTKGASPLTVQFSSEGSLDYDGDDISYRWDFGNGKKSTKANPSIKYSKAGEYTATLTVKDSQGNTGTSTIDLVVGNEVPKIAIELKGNQTFYWNESPISYQVNVQDKEDGKIAEDDIIVSINYLQGYDKTVLAQGHQMNVSFANGKRLMELSDCAACHQKNEKSIGPSYMDVSKKYRASSQNIDKLTKKVIAGGGGVWGEQAMAAHPQISYEDAREMVQYILSVGDEKKSSKPVAGDYMTNDEGKPGTYIINATYTDKGNNGIAPASNSLSVVLRSSEVPGISFDEGKDIMKFKVQGNEILIANQDNGMVAYKNLDLTEVKSISVVPTMVKGWTIGGKLTMRLDHADGKILGSLDIQDNTEKSISISEAGKHSIYLQFNNPEVKDKAMFMLKSLKFNR